jgi:antitoxin component YwqK of YwqJK toxin-antitoxin module
MNRFHRMTGALLCGATIVLSGCGRDDEASTDNLDLPDTLEAFDGSADDLSLEGISKSASGESLDPVIDVDPSEYTNYLASRDDAGGEPVFKELKEVLTKYENGKMKRAFKMQTFENYPPRIHGEFREWWDNGELWKKGEYKDGKQVGLWEFRSRAGEVVKKGTFVDGRPDGQWSYLRKDGTLQRIESYANGERDGAWTEYDETGKIPVQEVRFKNGQRHGTSIQWYPPQEGQQTPVKYREIHFVDGRQHGKAIQWYENGQVRNEIEFRNGRRHGRAAQFDENGNLVNELQFRDGEIVN